MFIDTFSGKKSLRYDMKSDELANVIGCVYKYEMSNT